MFDNYVGAKTQKRAKWKSIFLAASIIIHAVAVIALIVRSFWVIDKLEPPTTELALSVAAPPPPPPPPPPASSTTKTQSDTPKKRVVKDVVQPTEEKPDPNEIATEVDEGVAGGVEGGVIGGVEGGVVGGSLEGMIGGIDTGAPPPPPPPPPQPPQVVNQQQLEQKRVAGEKQIIPDDDVKLQISRAGASRVVATVKICINEGGAVEGLTVVKSSGYPSYDRKILAKMRQWRYSPYQVNGKAVAVCSPVTFIYNQTN